MTFLEELENNKKQTDELKVKTPKELWESCFKYFKHFVSILQKDNDNFQSNFEFVLLNATRPCLISGPFEIKRSQNDKTLKLVINYRTVLQKSINIKRKDLRSAELLQSRFSKEGLQSTIKKTNPTEFNVNLKELIFSKFELCLYNNKEFSINYHNVCTTTKKTLTLKINDINETTMDQIAKYILGQNENLYKETISDNEITKIREQIELNKKIKARRDAKIQEKIDQEKREEELRIANTLKEKSKRYINEKSQQIKQESKLFIKTNAKNIKNKLIEKLKNINKN